MLRDAMEATKVELAAKNWDRQSLLVKDVEDHHTEGDKIVLLQF